MKEAALIRAAFDARKKAFAPFSGFHVGAALLGQDRKIYTGCNIENSSYGLTICAERVAAFKAVSEGKRGFKAIAIVADTDRLTPPCGACRQILWELCGNIKVILANPKGKKLRYMLKDLLPEPFDSRSLQQQSRGNHPSIRRRAPRRKGGSV